MHGPTCIFWANLTAFSLQMSAAEQRNWLAEEIGARMVQKWIRGRHSRRSVKFLSHEVHEPAPGRTRGERQALTRVERDVEGEFLLSEFDTTFDEFVRPAAPRPASTRPA
jgi:hypothetical protein